MKHDLALPSPDLAEPIGRKGQVRLGDKPVLPKPAKPLEWSPDSPLPIVDEPSELVVAPEKVAVTAAVAADLRVERGAIAQAPVAPASVEVITADANPKAIKKARRTRAHVLFDDDEAAVVAIDPRRSNGR